tara:strand:- start:33 stop:410 length:378 start_codon:yes stop_codon:yes gene_type:complete
VHTNFQNEYFSDENGNVYMRINILGHVKNPGSHIVSEGADILTIISQAGGPLQGAKLKKVILYSSDQSKISTINLNDLFLNGEKINLVLKPNDTIYIKESLQSIILSRSVTSILQILNILITLLS